MTLRNRDVSTGRPPGNGNSTSFAEHKHDGDTVGSLVPPPVSDMDTAEWLVRNDLSLPGPAFERMQEILHGKRIVSPRDRADAFEQAFHEYHGYDYQTDLNARAGLAALEDAGHGDFAAALRTVLNARLSPGRATAPSAGTDELGAFVEDAAPVNDFNKHFYVTEDSGIFYDLGSDEAPTFANHTLVQADRDLTLEESDHLASLLAYAISAATHDRRTLEDYTEEGKDAIAQRPVDLIPLHQQEKISELMEEYVAEGTPLRTTDRSGPGTAGTRAIEGFGADAPQVRVLFALNN